MVVPARPPPRLISFPDSAVRVLITAFYLVTILAAAGFFFAKRGAVDTFSTASAKPKSGCNFWFDIPADPLAPYGQRLSQFQ